MRGVERAIERRRSRGFTVLAVLLAASFALAPAATAGPLHEGPGGADPLAALTPAQRAGAKALGMARAHLDAGRIAKARATLAHVRPAEALAGYAELLRVRILIAEGRGDEAVRVASSALEDPMAAKSDALRAALGVLRGEALAMGGDPGGAELAWNAVLGEAGPEDQAVRESIQLAIVESRQRTGSLEAGVDPRVLLDRNFGDVAVATEQVPAALLEGPVVLERAQAALEAGHPDEALELYETAIGKTLDPSQARRAKMGRARALFRERKYQSAAKAFGSLLPDVEARFWRARSLARSGDVDGSLEEFARVAEGDDPELASWALYLAGTLYEDRAEMDRAIDRFRQAAAIDVNPKRTRLALWREGWAQFQTEAFGDARDTFSVLVERTDDPIAALRPTYWRARAAGRAGDRKAERSGLEALARDFPLTYYGWRARERLGLDAGGLAPEGRTLAEGTRRIDDETIERAALLIEAGLDGMARDELRFAARRVRGFHDRTRVGVLLARVGDYHRANELVVIAYADSLARGLQPGREALWWLAWPPAHRETIEAVFPAEASIEPALVQAIMREESHYRVDARSSVGALGLLQLMPSTATQLARQHDRPDFEVEDLFDPETNIALGARYLDQLARRFDGRLSAAIASYNAGPRRVSIWLQGDAGKLEDDVWVENIPYDQTRAYVKRVQRSLHVYERFYR